MSRILCVALLAPYLAIALDANARGADDKDLLQGAWEVQSMISDGEPAPADAIKQMRFKFDGDKLFVRGNFNDDSEAECSYSIDPKKSPKHLDFSPPKETKPVLAIYELKGDELKICLCHGLSTEGRPTEFATKLGSKLVLILFKKQTP